MKQQLTFLLISLILLTGCTQIAQDAGGSEPVLPIPEPTATAAEVAPETDTSDANSSVKASDGTVIKLAFDGQGDTFLEAIDQTLGTLGEPLERRFWDGETDLKPRLQGELLIYEDQVLLFTQLSQDGGSEAARVEAPSIDDAFTLLQQAPMPIVEPSGAPDAEITFVKVRTDGSGVWSFDVSLDHPDTGWEDYVDGWHVETADGVILGTRILLHPHVSERPFTRSMRVAIPEDVTEVHIRSHDLVSGYGYGTVLVPIGEAGSGEKYEVSK